MARAEELYKRISDAGIDEINSLIRDSVSEELFLDYKRSANNGDSRTLHNSDKSNFSKAISGFGNSEGGVIIWGVQCSPDEDGADVPTDAHPIVNPTRFKSWLDGVASGLTVPPHSKVENCALVGEDGTGFVVTLIPQSDHAPHQTTQDKKYLMRAGSNFLPVPHAVLAGMFGRRPNARVFENYMLAPPEFPGNGSVRMNIGLALNNGGRGIAEHLYLTLGIYSTPGGNLTVELSRPDANAWYGSFSYGHKLGIVSNDGVRLPPGAFIEPIKMTLTLIPPFTKGLLIEGECGAANSESFPIVIKADAEQLERVVQEFHAAIEAGQAPHDAQSIISNFIFGVENV